MPCISPVATAYHILIQKTSFDRDWSSCLFWLPLLVLRIVIESCMAEAKNLILALLLLLEDAVDKF